MALHFCGRELLKMWSLHDPLQNSDIMWEKGAYMDESLHDYSWIQYQIPELGRL